MYSQDHWHHSPPHKFEREGNYFITASTYQRIHYFNNPEKISYLHDLLLHKAELHKWNLISWAVFANHYHFIGRKNHLSSPLNMFLRDLHYFSSSYINQLDNQSGRQIWFQFRDTHLSFQTSYFARLRYVNENAVHHKLVKEAMDYPWCSAAWFERNANLAFKRKLSTFKIDQLNLEDDF